jgi:hypothetical protein
LDKDKKKTYVVNPPDLIAIAYWVLVFSLGPYLIIRVVLNEKIALPFLLMVPSAIGVFIILFFLPFRVITFFITEFFLRRRLSHTLKNVPAETVVVIGKNNYSKPSFWVSPNYDTDLLLIVKYLRMLGKPFSIYYDTSVETLDAIMANEKIRTVYLIGHGRRHGYAIDGNTVVDYCRYNNPKFKKDYVYQIHCNHGRGTSIVEYVVPNENQNECLPEHGYMSNLTITQMFIDKIIKHKNHGGIHAIFLRSWYTLSTLIIPALVFITWGFVLTRMMG